MESSEPNTEQCENCHKMLASSKIATHLSYCRRNFFPCQQCGDLYDINYKEEHIADMHQLVQCTQCYKSFNNAEIIQHQKLCAPRFMLCQYCDLQVPEPEYVNHEKVCGARTIPCDACGTYVQKKAIAKHQAICFRAFGGCPVQQDISARQGQDGTKRRPKPRSTAVDIFKQTKQPASRMARNTQNQTIDLQQQMIRKKVQTQTTSRLQSAFTASRKNTILSRLNEGLEKKEKNVVSSAFTKPKNQEKQQVVISGTSKIKNEEKRPRKWKISGQKVTIQTMNNLKKIRDQILTSLQELSENPYRYNIPTDQTLDEQRKLRENVQLGVNCLKQQQQKEKKKKKEHENEKQIQIVEIIEEEQQEKNKQKVQEMGKKQFYTQIIGKKRVGETQEQFEQRCKKFNEFKQLRSDAQNLIEQIGKIQVESKQQDLLPNRPENNANNNEAPKLQEPNQNPVQNINQIEIVEEQSQNQQQILMSEQLENVSQEQEEQIEFMCESDYDQEYSSP